MELQLILSKFLFWVNNNGILASVGSIVLTIALAFSTGWVSEFFNKREKTRERVDYFMAKVTDTISLITAEGYRVLPSESDTTRLTRCAAQLERHGSHKLARWIREYMRNWNYYINLLKNDEDSEEGPKITANLDELTHKLLNSKRKN